MSLISLLFTNKNEKVLKYMNKKYGKRFGDEFWIFDTEYAGFTSGADKFFVHSKRFPKFVINVDRFHGKYEDSYMEIHFYKQYQEYMQPIMEEILGECKVFYSFDMIPTSLYGPKTTFEEYLGENRDLKCTYVVVRDDSDMLEKLKRLAEKLKELKLLLGSIRVHTAKDYDTIAKLDNLGEVGEYERSQTEDIYNPTFYDLDFSVITRRNAKMKFEYRELSNEKSEQLNAMGFKDMYGNECSFDGGEKCLTTSDEKIVFALVNYSHEEDFPDWYLLEYNGWYYMIDMFDRYQGAESLGKKLDDETLLKYKKKRKPITYFTANEITAIALEMQGNTEGKEPGTEEILAVLKELILVWNQYTAGRMNPGDRLVTTEIRYKGEIL